MIFDILLIIITFERNDFVEKRFDPSLWKPFGIKTVKVNNISLRSKINSFLDYQAPEDRYEVRGIMPSSKNKTLVGESEKVKKRVRKIEDKKSL